MTINYQILPDGNINTPGTYLNVLWNVLVAEETQNHTSPDQYIYNDGTGIPTIGVGFNLRTPQNLLAVMRQVLNNPLFDSEGSSTLTADQQLETNLQGIMASSWNATATKTQAEVVADNTQDVINAINDYYEKINLPTPINPNPTIPSIQLFVLTDAQAQAVFQTILGGYESQVNTFSSSIPGGHT
jgi:hypothetical protein